MTKCIYRHEKQKTKKKPVSQLFPLVSYLTKPRLHLVQDQTLLICHMLFPKAQNFFKEMHYIASLFPTLRTLNFSILSFLVSQNKRLIPERLLIGFGRPSWSFMVHHTGDGAALLDSAGICLQLLLSEGAGHLADRSAEASGRNVENGSH